MSRRVLAGIALLAVVVAVCLVVVVQDREGPSANDPDAVAQGPPGTTYDTGARPNIVFITTDDMTLDEMRYVPRVRRILGDQGVTFAEFTAPHPLCCPSRAQQLTGQYAQNNQVRSNSGAFGGYDQLDPTTTLPTWLQDAGYQTAMVGKYMNGYRPADAATQGNEPGWDHWDPTINGVYQYRGYGQYNDGEPVRPRAYHTDYVARRSSELIAEMSTAGAPFYLWTSFVSPHGRCPVRDEVGGCRFPPVVAQRHRGLYRDLEARARSKPSFNEPDLSDKPPSLRGRPRVAAEDVDALQRARAGALAAVDEGVAEIVRTLRASGAGANTLVVFASDNGYLLGEHRYQGKTLAYDESVRVPLLMAGLDLPRGVRSSQAAAMIDLAPTFADLAGATPVIEVDGRPIDVTQGVGAEASDDRTLLVQAGENVPGTDPTGWWYRGVRTARYTYVRFDRDGFVELYDRLRDPFELRNVADDPRYDRVRTVLAERTELLSACSGDDCRTDFGPAPPPDRVSPGASPLRRG